MLVNRDWFQSLFRVSWTFFGKFFETNQSSYVIHIGTVRGWDTLRGLC